MTIFVTVPVAANKIRAGDVIGRAKPETVVAADRFPAPAVTIRTATGAFVANPYDDIPLRMPVGHPVGAVGLYKADGSGVFGCICVYRVVDPSQIHESVAEDPGCPSHGIRLAYDDEWD